jgi:catechol 2,3-dioxygenase-like lactoylglutathione lyase family enzyme
VVLGSPVGACVAASDLEATRAFLSDIGAVIDGERGTVDVVAGEGRWNRRPLTGGTAALDFYVRSMGEREHVTIELGPLVMKQARVVGPDGLPVVLIEANHRRPSLLDASDAEVSEAHSLVWVVPSIDEPLAFFRDAGLTVAFDFPITSPAVCELMDLPDGTTVRMAMLGDEAMGPMRFELFEAPGTQEWDGVLRAGMAWPVFHSGALDLPWLSVREVSPGVHHCVAPGGVLVELRP